MKISDQELREKILSHLQLKGELATSSIVAFGNTWASNSKIRDVLQGLHEEALVQTRRLTQNRTAQVLWSRKETRYFELPEMVKLKEDVARAEREAVPISSLPQAERDDLAQKLASGELQLCGQATPDPVFPPITAHLLHEAEVQEVKDENEELQNTLKHEFNIILRKQMRRRDWAAKILQNSEAVIKNLEDKIKCL